ncbi:MULTISPECIES: citrate synthase [unclassified Achromobacter]|uniref:citrate synthase n=1 Tax=unclassified Achromobacter TaxID=2626865 RepID=UPI000B517E4E|nr:MULTISPECIES: citrate synthase [unclassified Achromobacter]OWT69100.1 citrate synthase [Achromobacter sp. HZ34]OWT70505.1 citrate synthase [Achromobacter sp. HZ28]
MAWISAQDALRILGVRPQTLYANVSRGRIRARPAPQDSRRSEYREEDVLRAARQARGRRKVATIAAEAIEWGDPVLPSSISTVVDGRHWYRGQDAIALAASAALEDIAALLWQTEPLTFMLANLARTPRAQAEAMRSASFRASKPARGDAKSGRYANDRQASAQEISDQNPDTRSTAGVKNRGATPDSETSSRPISPGPALTAGLAAMAQRAGRDLPTIGRTPATLRAEARDVMADLCAAMLGAPVPAEVALHHHICELWRQPAAANFVRRALVLMADHELNASAFSVRVTISTGASLAAGVLAGLATLSGPLHAGATQAVAALAEEARQHGPEGAVRACLAQGRALPGFGHPLYPDGDPRAAILLATSKPPPHYRRLAEYVEASVGEIASVDFALTAGCARHGLPPDSPFVLFALGRCVGWLAHALEQAQAQRLIRPRARYVGVAPGASLQAADGGQARPAGRSTGALRADPRKAPKTKLAAGT